MNINWFGDSDGVIFDFDSHVKAHSGGIPPRVLGDAPLWNLVNSIPDFWETMPLFPWSHDLINFMRPLNVTILTGCPRDGYERAAQGKVAKYAQHFPGIPVITCLSRNKGTFVKNKGDVLLDDTHKNIKRWNDAGGHGIFFRNYEQAIRDMTAIIERNVS